MLFGVRTGNTSSPVLQPTSQLRPATSRFRGCVHPHPPCSGLSEWLWPEWPHLHIHTIPQPHYTFTYTPLHDVHTVFKNCCAQPQLPGVTMLKPGDQSCEGTVSTCWRCGRQQAQLPATFEATWL